jgi:spore coat protein A
LKPKLSNKGKATTTAILIVALALSSFAMLGIVEAAPPLPAGGPTLDPRTIPKYVNQLVIPPVYQPTNVTDPNTGALIRQDYTVDMTQFYEQILPTTDALGNPTGFGQTLVWGYGGQVTQVPGTTSPGYFAYSPGATFEAVRGVPVQVTWQNKITQPNMFAVDPTLHWANPNNMPMMPPMPWPVYPPGFPDAQSPVPLIPHLHGAEVQSTSDGYPDAWFTASASAKYGSAYSTNDEWPSTTKTPGEAVFYYPNAQPPTTLWYHDHALGITRLNVMSGLAGFYLLRDPADTVAPLLPSGQYEIPLVFQDRSFNLDGSFWFPSVGLNPTIHPYWQPEFFGNTIMVNGKVWPNLNVEPRQYRFRLLDGSNARFYTISLLDKVSGTFLPITQIGGDGGYLPAPAAMTSLTIAPGERCDILVDFSALPAGTQLLMKNTAKAPYPGGAAADPQTTGQVMQFTVTAGTPVTPAALPATLLTMPVLTPDATARMLTLTEVMGALGPVEILLDGQKWGATISETPQVGATEDWIIINPTADTHPIHLHLVQFEVISRQNFQVNKYMKAWTALNGMPPLTSPTVNVPSITPYLTGKAQAPAANELGWKDTVQAPTGMVTIIRVRFAPLDAPTAGLGTPTPGTNLYPFDPTVGPGYVWHCHILDHEDNEMMRPYQVTP